MFNHSWFYTVLLSWYAFYCYDKDCDQKKIGEERAYLASMPRHRLSVREVWAGAHGRGLNAGTEAEAIEEGCATQFLSYTQDHLPRRATVHSRVGCSHPGPPTSITNQENVPQACLLANLERGRVRVLLL